MRRLSLVLAALSVALGCGSSGTKSSGNGIPGISIQLVSPSGPAAVDANQQLALSVSVNDPAGVTWGVAAAQAGDPVGTLSAPSSTSVTYNPPANLTAPVQMIVTATSITDNTRSLTVPIANYPAPQITTQSSGLSTAFVNTSYSCIQMPITQSGVVQIPCQVTVSGGLSPYTWSLGSNQLPAGLQLSPGLTANSTQIVGTPTLPGIYPFPITVTDSLGGTSTAALNINVAPGQLKVVTPTLLSTIPGVPYAPVAMQASGGTPPYTWSIAPGSGPLPPGMAFSPQGVIYGTPTDLTASSFAVRVTDSQTPVPAEATFPSPSSSNAKIMTLAGSGLDPTCLSGGSTVLTGTPYAFLFTGFDANGPVTLSGSFTADASGNLTGAEDIVRNSGAALLQPLTAGSSISFNQVGRGCITLNTATSSAQFRLAETTILSGNAGAYFNDGRIIQFDDVDGTGTRGSGFFHIQDSGAFSTNSITGTYAFRFSGWNSTGGHFAMAGTAAAGGGLWSSVSADVNNAGSGSGALNGGNGTIGAVDANGRSQVSLSIGSATYNLICYALDAHHLIFNSPQSATSAQPLITGEMISVAGPFTQGTLSNSHVYRLGGYISGSPDVEIGVLHFDGVSALSGASFQRSGGTSSATPLSGQYAIDATTGRITFSGTAVKAVGYVIPAANGLTAFLVGVGASASSGVLEFQTSSYPPGYQFSPINGRYGFGIDEMLDSQTTVFVASHGDGPNGSITDSYVDSSIPLAPGLAAAQDFTMFRYTWNPDGTGTYGGNTYMVSNESRIFYIDTSPLNGHPAVVVGQRVQ